MRNVLDRFLEEIETHI